MAVHSYRSYHFSSAGPTRVHQRARLCAKCPLLLQHTLSKARAKASDRAFHVLGTALAKAPSVVRICQPKKLQTFMEIAQ